MSSCRSALLARVVAGWMVALWAGAALAQTVAYPGIGRPATAGEIAAWDIDVRPDFKGLPRGQGSVTQGQAVWEAKCATCHGIFGESNEVFMPLIGGTTADDVRTGRVARLNDASFPARTMLMKLATVSTLWDYIRRAMPWTAPKSLSVDEVYAVTAFLLNLGGVVADDFVLSEQSIAQAQARMPNRNGMTTDHALWPGKGWRGAAAPDVKASACMTNCAAEPRLSSFLPEHARMNHGNLAEQVRAVGAQHGVDTRQAGGAAAGATAVSPAPVSPAQVAPASGDNNAAVLALLSRHGCVACHAVERKVVGPGFRDVARKHGARADAAAYLAGKIRSGGSGVWGTVPMPPQTAGDEDVRMIARWLANGAGK